MMKSITDEMMEIERRHPRLAFAFWMLVLTALVLYVFNASVRMLA